VTRPRHLLISAELTAYIRTLHPELKRKVRATLDTVLADPSSGKPLRGPLAGFCAVHVGKFRVIYRPAVGAIRIVAIGPRTRIYEEPERLRRGSPHD
jgi:mRNA interferase RelE/StbE